MMYYSFLTFSLLYLSSTFFSFFFFFNDTATTEIYTLSLHDALPISRRLRALTLWLLGRFGGAFRPMRRLPLAPLRRELLAVPGLGPETADAILLYGAERPVFVADAYARRVLVRHRLLRRPAGYEQARAFLEAHLPSDPALFNEYHALLVAIGKTHCRTVPRCERCPLRFDLRGRGPAA